jgi:hypothetical protein
MKHIKYIKELNTETYLSAANKLKKLGHGKRHDGLKNWALKGIYKEYYKLGTFKHINKDYALSLSLTGYFLEPDFSLSFNFRCNLINNNNENKDLYFFILVYVENINDDDFILNISLDTDKYGIKNDRKLSTLTKKHLLDAFSNPSYTDLNTGDSLKNKIESEVFQGLDISLDYGLDIEDIYNKIKRYRINLLYKE